MSLLLNEDGIKGLLESAGVHIVFATGNDYVCLCPFHTNMRTPSMTVSRKNGMFNCFNPGCGAKGDFINLMARTNHLTRAEADRLVEKVELSLDDMVARLKTIDVTKTDDINEFSQHTVDARHQEFWGSPGHAYMRGRGFDDHTLDYFQIGYSGKQRSVMVPVHSYTGVLMGVVGRKIDEKRFINSTGFQGRKTLFNVHRARKHGQTLIIVEASFDAMRIHQAGYPNAAALLKGTLTDEQEAIIKRSFTEVVIFVDNDNPKDYPGMDVPPGQALAKTIYNRLRSTTLVYKVPFAAYVGKDASDMTDDQITHALSSAQMMGLDTNA
jgi:DNA primase